MSLSETVQAGDRGHPELHNALAQFYNRWGFVLPPEEGQGASAMLNAALNAGHGVVTCAPGTYRIDATIALDSGQSLRGLVPGATIFEVDAGVTAITINSAQRWLLENLTITGGAVGIKTVGSGASSRAIMRNLSVTRQTEKSIYIENALYHSILEQINCGGGGGVNTPYGMIFYCAQGNNTNSLINCQFRETGTAGLRFDGSQQFSTGMMTLLNCTFESNWQHAIQIHSERNIIFISPYFENNGRDTENGPYPEVALSGVDEGHMTKYVTFVNAYNSGQANNRGGLFLSASNEFVHGVRLIQHAIGASYGVQTDDGTLTGDGIFDTLDNDMVWTRAIKGPVITSPNGTRYRIRVADDGALSSTEM